METLLRLIFLLISVRCSRGTRDQQISQIRTMTRDNDRFRALNRLQKDIKKFLQQVVEKE
jgi:hypothetical protein